MAVKKDQTLAEAVDLAREAAESIAEPGAVGDHLGMTMDDERLATHSFACTTPAYRGWRWAVVVTRVARSRKVTICETNLLPGPDALLAPEWVPYVQRLQPGDVGPGDVLPYTEDDENLEPGFEATGEEDVDQMAQWELGLGRARVLSAEGRDTAAQRWYDGDHGPHAEVAEKSREMCLTCGYYLPLAGALRVMFGVCANAWSPSDGKVVSRDHGCGAHSESDVRQSDRASVAAPVVDDLAVDVLG
ncbi:DUF3027 domain-containing protein [Mobilicoccus sp.]|uniref:DUF3027 domain-containing protein n=1 Tax=Mobilicoccus sp. TaxID=2034349 RepID=UPI00289C70B0|nr:DUF3027 domain-containing protein [Mobilicoccus sp.]